MTPGDVLALFGFVFLCAGLVWAGWEWRGRDVRDEQTRRCCDCLTKIARERRQNAARDAGLLT